MFRTQTFPTNNRLVLISKFSLTHVRVRERTRSDWAAAALEAISPVIGRYWSGSRLGPSPLRELRPDAGARRSPQLIQRPHAASSLRFPGGWNGRRALGPGTM